MRPNIEHGQFENCVFGTAFRSKPLVTTIADNFQITKDMPFVLYLDPNGGAKDVRLPTEDDVEHKGLCYAIVNMADAAEAITVKNDDETETVGTLNQGSLGFFFNSGTADTGWVGRVLEQGTSGQLVIGTTTLSEAELAVLDGVTAGTVTASKAVVANADTNLGVAKVTELHVGASGSEVQVTATPAELNRHCDTSANLVLVGGTSLAVTTALHDGKTIGLDHTAAASTCTLPDATGSGARFRFVVVAVNTNNHVITVPDTDNVMSGSVNLLDNDGYAQTAYAASGTDDTLTLNGSTKGGQVGDWVEFLDVAADTWAVRGQLVCPAGDYVTDPFSAAV